MDSRKEKFLIYLKNDTYNPFLLTGFQGMGPFIKYRNENSFLGCSKSSTMGPRYNEPLYIMHLSMLSPRLVGGGGGGGGGQADPGEFDILMAARVKFPTPRHLLNVNFPPLG